MKKSKRGGKRITIMLDSDVLSAFEDWRAKQRLIPKVTRAVNTLLYKSLEIPEPQKKGIKK